MKKGARRRPFLLQFTDCLEAEPESKLLEPLLALERITREGRGLTGADVSRRILFVQKVEHLGDELDAGIRREETLA